MIKQIALVTGASRGIGRAIAERLADDGFFVVGTATSDAGADSISDYLGEKLNYDYTYLANLFSEVKGTTIEKFYLTHKIEKVKELIVYDELNLTEIADKLHYSSVAHLSNQFKKITGLTPSHFKKLKRKRISTLGNV